VHIVSIRTNTQPAHVYTSCCCCSLYLHQDWTHNGFGVVGRRAHEFDEFAATVVLEDSPKTVIAMLAQGSTSAVLPSVNANGTAVTRLMAGVDSVQDFQDR
jgi:hypothetical protein